MNNNTNNEPKIAMSILKKTGLVSLTPKWFKKKSGTSIQNIAQFLTDLNAGTQEAVMLAKQLAHKIASVTVYHDNVTKEQAKATLQLYYDLFKFEGDIKDSIAREDNPQNGVRRGDVIGISGFRRKAQTLPNHNDTRNAWASVLGLDTPSV